MRTALLIGLMIAASLASSGAQAQTQRRPYDPPKPYELPKEYGTNPYDRDYSKTDRYENQSKQRRGNGDSSRDSSYGPGPYGSRPSGLPSTWTPAGSQRNPNCNKPGIVC